jgi:hypothetical protein
MGQRGDAAWRRSGGAEWQGQWRVFFVVFFVAWGQRCGAGAVCEPGSERRHSHGAAYGVGTGVGSDLSIQF